MSQGDIIIQPIAAQTCMALPDVQHIIFTCSKH